jgi:glucose-1-phosphatase
MASSQYTGSPIRTIIFDLGKVIVDFDHMTFCDNLSSLCALPAEAVYEHIFLSGLEKLFDSGRLSPEAFFEAARTRLSLSIDMDHFSRLWSDIFSLNPGIDTLINGLKDKYRLLCLSNTNPWHFTWCRQHFAVLNMFDDFILSYEANCCKPDRAIFEIALGKANARPEQCIFIDDSADNVRGARQLNITAFIFTTVATLTQDLSAAGIPCPARRRQDDF